MQRKHVRASIVHTLQAAANFVDVIPNLLGLLSTYLLSDRLGEFDKDQWWLAKFLVLFGLIFCLGVGCSE